jgi:hypothetical protein
MAVRLLNSEQIARLAKNVEETQGLVPISSFSAQTTIYKFSKILCDKYGIAVRGYSELVVYPIDVDLVLPPLKDQYVFVVNVGSTSTTIKYAEDVEYTVTEIQPGDIISTVSRRIRLQGKDIRLVILRFTPEVVEPSAAKAILYKVCSEILRLGSLDTVRYRLATYRNNDSDTVVAVINAAVSLFDPVIVKEILTLNARHLATFFQREELRGIDLLVAKDYPAHVEVVEILLYHGWKPDLSRFVQTAMLGNWRILDIMLRSLTSESRLVVHNHLKESLTTSLQKNIPLDLRLKQQRVLTQLG